MSERECMVLPQLKWQSFFISSFRFLSWLLRTFRVCHSLCNPVIVFFRFIFLPSHDLLSVMNYLLLVYICWLNCICKTHFKHLCQTSSNTSSSLQYGCQVRWSYSSVPLTPVLHNHRVVDVLACCKICILTMKFSSHTDVQKSRGV